MPDESTVPAQPLYSMMIRADQESGLALDIDGQTLATDPDIAVLRAKGLAELRIRAAFAGRPVRARAVEPTALTPWLMIVSPDGSVTDVAEHPTPATEKSRHGAAPMRPGHAMYSPDPPATLKHEEHRAAWVALWSARAAGDGPAAVVLAHRLEAELQAAYGSLHPATVTVLTARAWLTLCQRTDRYETTELLITTALRCQAAKYPVQADTVRTARNAHACWRQLMQEDPEAATSLAGSLADMLAILGEDERRRDVLERIAAVPATG
ncbi:hypothetical protein ACFV0B_37900 [Streptomyces xanthophaeus]|uniref:hypothetical protein n=1 Tax=Streptomyces xanthophaeus TaxID=67385 RepID=UPI00368CA5DC